MTGVRTGEVVSFGACRDRMFLKVFASMKESFYGLIL
jgi:hypothetical protein